MELPQGRLPRRNSVINGQLTTKRSIDATIKQVTLDTGRGGGLVKKRKVDEVSVVRKDAVDVIPATVRETAEHDTSPLDGITKMVDNASSVSFATSMALRHSGKPSQVEVTTSQQQRHHQQQNTTPPSRNKRKSSEPKRVSASSSASAMSTAAKRRLAEAFTGETAQINGHALGEDRVAIVTDKLKVKDVGAAVSETSARVMEDKNDLRPLKIVLTKEKVSQIQESVSPKHHEASPARKPEILRVPKLRLTKQDFEREGGQVSAAASSDRLGRRMAVSTSFASRLPRLSPPEGELPLAISSPGSSATSLSSPQLVYSHKGYSKYAKQLSPEEAAKAVPLAQQPLELDDCQPIDLSISPKGSKASESLRAAASHHSPADTSSLTVSQLVSNILSSSGGQRVGPPRLGRNNRPVPTFTFSTSDNPAPLTHGYREPDDNSMFPGGKRKCYKNMTRERRVEANARERTRVHTISAAFEALRRAIPCYSCHQKLSKLAILRIAAVYIMALGKLLGIDYSPDPDHSDMSFADCVELCTRTIQEEGRAKKISKSGSQTVKALLKQ